MGLWGDWQASRERRHRVGLYLNHVLREPDAGALAWLTTLTGSPGVAARELTFARRAVGLIVAERDALDDRTAADVAHQLAPVIAAEARRDAAIGREWTDRWREYTSALAVRGSAEPPAARLARVMLTGAGVRQPTTEQHGTATQCVLNMRAALNEQLRAAIGAASLPDDVRPSALRG
ncbi:MAG: hypothetical protein ACK5XT_14705 [Gemmatimonas sp.]|jgi:hypothetical protein|uniref:hypothetical protein n=1 Tax=Gemmatimonas sp. TaxID=1962908 RepID=UPI00391F13EB|nr:hypothetical protein [Gemmatimonadota bacterium]